jgi:PKD repeat protein
MYCVTVQDSNGCTVSDCITVTVADQPNPPVAEFDANVTSGCDALTVQFTDQSTNNPTSWTWDFGDGSGSNEENPTHTYSVPGTYSVSLIVSNADGTSDPELHEDYIVLGETPVIELSITEESIEGASDGSVMVTASGSDSPFTYLWTGGATVSELSSLPAGLYCVTVYSATGCSVTDCITLTVADQPNPPVAEFEADETFACGELTVQFTDQSTNNPTEWAWDFGDGSDSNLENPTHTYATPGTYTVSLTVSNSDGTSDPEIKTDYITIGEIPQIELTMTEESAEGANDGTITVNITGGELPYMYAWDNDGDTHVITGLTAGTYCVTVTDANGCSADACIEVTIAGDEELTADFEANITSGCSPLEVQFTDLSTGNPTGWTWNFGDGGTSSDQNPIHVYNTDGIYTVILVTTNDENASDTEVKTSYITVFASPVVTIDEVINASGEDVADGGATINITGGLAPYSILWSNDETGLSIENVLPGTYSVMVIDDNACVVTTPVVIGWDVSVAGHNAIDFDIYPNPANEQLHVIFGNVKADYISVVNVLGEEVIRIKALEKEQKISVAALSPGVYFVRLTSNSGEFVKKLIVK